MIYSKNCLFYVLFWEFVVVSDITASSMGTVEDMGTEMLKGTQTRSPIPQNQEKIECRI